MTGVRARIAAALREALRYLAVLNQSSTKPPDAQWDIVSDHLTEVLLALDGIAVVALPTQMADRSGVAERIRDRPMWLDGDAWASLTDTAGEIEFEADRQNAYGTLSTTADARALAGALLAAADAAEQAGK